MKIRCGTVEGVGRLAAPMLASLRTARGQAASRALSVEAVRCHGRRAGKNKGAMETNESRAARKSGKNLKCCFVADLLFMGRE